MRGPTGAISGIRPTSPPTRDVGSDRAARSRSRSTFLFFLLAKWMHEPFVDAWHRRDVVGWLAPRGFTLVADDAGMPIRFITAIRR
jgi:hypothetical protein